MTTNPNQLPTPRVDAYYKSNHDWNLDWPNFARTLERELAESHASHGKSLLLCEQALAEANRKLAEYKQVQSFALDKDYYEKFQQLRAELELANRKLNACMSSLHKCYALTGYEAGDIDDFRALIDRERHTIEAVAEMRKERDDLESSLEVAKEALEKCDCNFSSTILHCGGPIHSLVKQALATINQGDK